MSNFEVIQDSGLPVKMWTKGVPVEDSAKSQLLNLSRMPFVHKHVAAMPDVHWGMGATVGNTGGLGGDCSHIETDCLCEGVGGTKGGAYGQENEAQEARQAGLLK